MRGAGVKNGLWHQAVWLQCELYTVICTNYYWLTGPNESSQIKMDYASNKRIRFSIVQPPGHYLENGNLDLGSVSLLDSVSLHKSHFKIQ